MTAVPASPARATRSAARPSMATRYPEVAPHMRPLAEHPAASVRAAGARGPLSAGEGLGGVQPGEDLEVAQHAGELVDGPRLAAPATVLGEADQSERAAGLVLLDREVAGDGVPVTGAGRRAEAETPAGDDHGAAVVPDLADLEDRRLVTPTHGRLPLDVPPARAGLRCASAPQPRHRRVTPGT